MAIAFEDVPEAIKRRDLRIRRVAESIGHFERATGTVTGEDYREALAMRIIDDLDDADAEAAVRDAVVKLMGALPSDAEAFGDADCEGFL